MKRTPMIVGTWAFLWFGGWALAENCNIKIITDASPDYADMPSLIHSATSAWPTPAEKCWAMFYWNHIGRRQTTPMRPHQIELTDPIRQFNDYGFTMCSTIAGMNNAIWHGMGFDVRYWDISLHTVPEVQYDGRWHMYDNSMSALYTLCDGATIAAVEDIGKELGCPASGGKAEPGHIARYHCLTATSANGFLTGADCPRSLESEGTGCFNPKGLKFRPYTNGWDWGHRFILNLRENESYTRYYHRLDAQAPKEGKGAGKDAYASDPACYVPNFTARKANQDPEAPNPRYHLRGNGQWVFRPALTGAEWRKFIHMERGIAAVEGAGLQPEKAGEAGEVVFRVQSANVTTSQKIHAEFFRHTADDIVKLAVSVNNGLTWKPVWQADALGEIPVDLPLIEEVSGAYEPMLQVTLLGKASPSDAVLKILEVATLTQVNAKALPRLNVGRNTVYVGLGDPTESIVLWPDLRDGFYQEDIVEESNMAAAKEPKGYFGPLHPAQSNEEGFVVYRIQAPNDIVRLTYGGRFYNRAADGAKGYIRLLHSNDGRNWTESWTLDNKRQPWDVIHYETVEIPRGVRSVWMKYALRSPNVNDTGSGCSIYSLRMEANYLPPETAFQPMQVALAWKEIQQDRSLVERSHTQIVDRVPCVYTVNVGGEDHPIMESLQVKLAGHGDETTSGYSDGKDVGGGKFLYSWVSCGSNLAEGKPYTISIPSLERWGAGDPQGTKLTDGIVGPNYVGGTTPKHAVLWDKGQTPEITVDLGEIRRCGAFRIHLGAGFPWWDALKGEVQDQVQLLTSHDGKEFVAQGDFNLNLWRKDIPINHMLPDDETAQAFPFEWIPAKPLEARFVRYRLAAARAVTVSEVQVFDWVKHEPFDIRIALPPEKK